MLKDGRVYSPPRRRLTRWLLDAGPDVPPDIRVNLIGSLFSSLPVFFGGVINTVLVSAVITLRIPRAQFIAWLALELIVCGGRLLVLLHARNAASEARGTPTDGYVALGLCWACSVGYGTFISMISGDWVVATLACVSSAAMVGGICFRNFGAPRLSAAMTVLSLGPVPLGAIFAGEPILWVTLLQTPLYLFAMTAAGYQLNANLVATMRAEQDNERRARRDALTDLLNRNGLERAIEAKWSQRQSATEQFALLYIDLDGFKAVNDRHGHAIGDRLLQRLADRLKGLVRQDDAAARVGGDEFVVFSEVSDRGGALTFAERLIVDLSAPFELGNGLAPSVGACIGIALAPQHGRDMVSLLAAADIALYEAKSRGRSSCIIAS
ncbi:MAG: GGDEF domain-containing protein [Xanthobacteraceae bacterium]|nr:GGDEF domain-containing protein [Xanthobacteraceae bacterium]